MRRERIKGGVLTKYLEEYLRNRYEIKKKKEELLKKEEWHTCIGERIQKAIPVIPNLKLVGELLFQWQMRQD